MNIDEIVLRLKDKYPTIRTELNYSNAHELLFAVILSAQCTDKRVNIVTKELFAKYKTVEDYADADINELKKIIRSTGFYNNKVKNIIGAAKKLRDEFGSKVPDRMEDLITLPGVARKTANVVLYEWFDKNEGIAVDTHVSRITQRLGITKETKPEKIEKGLIEKIPNRELGGFSMRLVQFGRDVCQAKKPDCANCPMKDICPSAFKFDK